MKSTATGNENNKPLVSAIMIFWNGEKFMVDAIESVFAQSYANWELILADDGSTDAGTEIAKGYAERHPGRVHLVEHAGHQNLGMSASRNLGIRYANGEYVTFLDADDVWLPHKLERQVRLLVEHPEAAMVYGPTQYWYGWTRSPDDVSRDFIARIGVEPNTLIEPPALLTRFLETDGAIVPVPSSVLVRRDTIEALDGFEEGFPRSYEDQVFLSKICLERAVLVTDDCSDKYRQHPNSSSRVWIRDGEYHPVLPHPGRKRYLSWLATYLKERGVEDRQLWKALRKQLRPYRHPILYALTKPRIVLRRVKRFLKRIVEPTPLSPIWRQATARWKGQDYCPPLGGVRFGSLGRLKPIGRDFGRDRGLPIDRYYIERFLARHADDVRGRALEIADCDYTRRFGGSRVTASDVLHVAGGNPAATIVGDLTEANHIPPDSFDCIIFTQTLQYIYDLRAAIRTLHRTLKPGGVVLATFPGISQIGNDEWSEGWCWSLTCQSARLLFEESFPPENVRVESHGNLLSAVAFLQGLATEELRRTELDHEDPRYEVIVTLRAVKPGAPADRP